MVKIISANSLRGMEEEVNSFIEGKNVFDIKMMQDNNSNYITIILYR